MNRGQILALEQNNGVNGCVYFSPIFLNDGCDGSISSFGHRIYYDARVGMRSRVFKKGELGEDGELTKEIYDIEKISVCDFVEVFKRLGVIDNNKEVFINEKRLKEWTW